MDPVRVYSTMELSIWNATNFCPPQPVSSQEQERCPAHNSGCHSNLPFDPVQPVSAVHAKPVSSNDHPTIRPACFSLLVSPRSHHWMYFTVSLLLFPSLVSSLFPPISDCGLGFKTWAKEAPESRAPRVQLLVPASWDFNTGTHSVTLQPTGAS